MLHKIRWTSQKISQHLVLVESLVYRHTQHLPPSYFLQLAGPADEPPFDPRTNVYQWELIRLDQTRALEDPVFQKSMLQ